MGLDGFSIGNLGLPNELTSAQMAKQAEQLALRESEIIIKNVNEAAKENGVKRKEKSDKENDLAENFKKKKKKQGEDSQQREKNQLLEKEFENKDPREYSVRINPDTNLVELYNNKEKKIVETISPDDLMQLISKLSSVSGILVNRKI